MKLLENTIIEARKKTIYLAKENNIKMNLCLDKGYYGAPAEIIAFIYGYESHIQSRGEEKKYPFSHTLANSERAQLSDCYSFHSVVEA